MIGQRAEVGRVSARQQPVLEVPGSTRGPPLHVYKLDSAGPKSQHHQSRLSLDYLEHTPTLQSSPPTPATTGK